MLVFNCLKASPLLLEKINGLCGLLWQGKRDYEQAAAVVPDKELSRTILTLALESNQYACELSSQIQVLGGVSPKEFIYGPSVNVNTKMLQDKKGILNFCRMSEWKMVNAYQKILNESHLYDGFTKMIQYQLNGIQRAYMQLKLLNSLKLY
ncbi:MAG: hypothetical protein ICV51_22395 [Flavisolibacter sp.]|nr:hypothetical protein [Flavisolibacter sp.]MBD0378366.1 hypothetical protein [Flavisolibacter sp.]